MRWAALSAPGVRGPRAPFDHVTGKYYVAPHKGQYVDALSKGRQVWVLVAEVTGAGSTPPRRGYPRGCAARAPWLARQAAKVKGHRDDTAYGASRMATRDFATHHMYITCGCSRSLSRPPSASPSSSTRARSRVRLTAQPATRGDSTCGAPPYSPRPALEDILERRP